MSGVLKASQKRTKRALDRGLISGWPASTARLVGDYNLRDGYQPREAHHQVLREVLLHLEEISFCTAWIRSRISYGRSDSGTRVSRSDSIRSAGSLEGRRGGHRRLLEGEAEQLADGCKRLAASREGSVPPLTRL
jgi:hypothetical protein